MKKLAAIVITSAAAALILASAKGSKASIEAGQGETLPGLDFSTISDTLETMINTATETTADTAQDVAGANIAAFLELLKQAEGTANSADPYRVCYAYKHTINSFADHPTISGEWPGETLPPGMCKSAGFGPGCKSTAAGAYQIIKPTWASIKDKLGLTDFEPTSQDAAAVELIRRRGALEDVKAGRVTTAIEKCRNEWASLPGNYAKQGQRKIETLLTWYETAGGTAA